MNTPNKSLTPFPQKQARRVKENLWVIKNIPGEVNSFIQRAGRGEDRSRGREKSERERGHLSREMSDKRLPVVGTISHLLSKQQWLNFLNLFSFIPSSFIHETSASSSHRYCCHQPHFPAFWCFSRLLVFFPLPNDLLNMRWRELFSTPDVLLRSYFWTRNWEIKKIKQEWKYRDINHGMALFLLAGKGAIFGTLYQLKKFVLSSESDCIIQYHIQAQWTLELWLGQLLPLAL